MNALEIVRAACQNIGLPQPNTVTGSSDTSIRQLLGLLNSEGRQLSVRYDWEVLVREKTFPSAAAEDQGSLTDIIGAPNAYRHILNDTLWNRSTNQPIYGPKSSVDWQVAKTLGRTGPYTEYRIRGSHLLLLPAPGAGEEIAFEYVTRNWCTSDDGQEQRSAITKDEDEVVLDAEIMIAGLDWRWRKAKGLSYAEEFNSYERLVAVAMDRDGTKRALSLAAGTPTRERRFAVSPGSWPL